MLAVFAATAVGLIGGCIGGPQNPAATQPATVVDLATTQPWYWLSQPALARVRGDDFDTTWEACKSVAREYGYALDREDFRAGVITTVPMVSKQIFEPWRRDTGTLADTWENSTATIRRQLRFEIARDADGSYTATPKVLVERLNVLERRVTEVSQYRTAFAGPAVVSARESARLDPETSLDVPIKYWYPVGRDTAMEEQAAEQLRRAIDKRQQLATNVKLTPTPVTPLNVTLTGPALETDGLISAMGPNGEIYINVGAADKVVPGMTFEVYAARATLPSLESYGPLNAQSKGWIEVTAVANGSSTCKAIRTIGAAPPKAGDAIFNFVFRRGTPNRFAVLGDLAAGRDAVTGLITHWNGVVDVQVSPGTNYLIVGKSPQGEAARRAYDAARSQAELLKTPILSEERFDLLVRYYDSGKR